MQRRNELESSYPRSSGHGQYVMDPRCQGEYDEDPAPRSAAIAAPVLILTAASIAQRVRCVQARPRSPRRRRRAPPGHMSWAGDTAVFAGAIHRFLVAHPE